MSAIPSSSLFPFTLERAERTHTSLFTADRHIQGFAGDTLSASHYIADLAKQAGHEIPKAKSLPKSLEHITKIDKVVSASSMKVIHLYTGILTHCYGKVDHKV